MPQNRSVSVGETLRRRRVGRYLMTAAVLIGGLAATAIAASYLHDMRDAREQLARIPTELYESRYGNIEYYLAGQGPTVLISHGVTGGIDQGIRLTHEFGFFGKGYRFLYVSRFGYFKSTLPSNASARLQAAAYRELLDHLGIDRVYIFGNSAGGTSTMWFAIDFPERTQGLILHSSAIPGPVLAAPPNFIFESDFAYWAVCKAAPDLIIGSLLPPSIRATLSKDQKAFVVKNVFMASLPITERTSGVNFDNGISTPSVNEIPFERIRVPTLILQATDDPRERSGGRRLAGSIAGSEYVGLTGGHLLLGRQDEAQARITEFISSQN